MTLTPEQGAALNELRACERAETIVANRCASIGALYAMALKQIHAAVKEARLEEREACARVVEDLNSWGQPECLALVNHIAKVIRARSSGDG